MNILDIIFLAWTIIGCLAAIAFFRAPSIRSRTKRILIGVICGPLTLLLVILDIIYDIFENVGKSSSFTAWLHKE